VACSCLTPLWCRDARNLSALLEEDADLVDASRCLSEGRGRLVTSAKEGAVLALKAIPYTVATTVLLAVEADV
jgi:hypothetical protein